MWSYAIVKRLLLLTVAALDGFSSFASVRYLDTFVAVFRPINVNPGFVARAFSPTAELVVTSHVVPSDSPRHDCQHTGVHRRERDGSADISASLRHCQDQQCRQLSRQHPLQVTIWTDRQYVFRRRGIPVIVFSSFVLVPDVMGSGTPRRVF